MSEEGREPSPEVRFGAYLRQERELREVDLQRVAEFTKLGVELLEALEAGRWERFPARVYLRGAVQAYARAVGLDPNDVLLRLDELGFPAERGEETPASSSGRSVPIRVVRRRGRRRDWPWLVLVLLAAGVAIVSWRQGRRQQEVPAVAAPPLVPGPDAVTMPSTVTAAISPSTTSVAPEPPPPVHRVELRAVGESWVQGKIDGRPPQEWLLRPGQRLTFAVTREVRFKVGNAGGVELRVDDEPAAPLGATGVVRIWRRSFGGRR